MKIVRWLLVAAALSSLMAILAWLYVKTQAVNLDRRNEIVLHLRELKALDAQWNVDTLKSRMGINKNYDPITDPLVSLRAIEADLETETQTWLGNASLGTLDKLKKAFAEKTDLTDQFKSQNAILRNSLRYLPTGTESLKTMIGELESENATGSETLAFLKTQVSDMLTDVLKFNLIPDAGIAERLVQSLAVLEKLQPEYPAALAEPMTILLNHARVVIRQRSAEDELLKALAEVPTVAAIDNLGNEFEQGFQSALNESQQYRSYLFVYSILLLVLLAYAGWRLTRSYKLIAAINKDLKISNETLEQRVEERTAELSKALYSLQESEAHLIQAEKMASLGQMIAGVAHEINTPLAYVRSGFETVGQHLSELVSEVIAESEKLVKLVGLEKPPIAQLQAQYLKTRQLQQQFSENQVLEELDNLVKDGVHGVDQISELVVNLKNFSRLDRGKVVQFDLHEGLKSTLVIAKHLLKDKTVKQHFRNIPPVTCAPSQINQVFLNLISNAAQATPQQGGVIYLLTGMHPSGKVKIEVVDNGSGIPEDVLPRIFDPFFTTKEIGKGTGLGLSIVYKIIQEHGGTIEVDSKVGKGTKFTVLLPVDTELALAA